MQNQAMKTDPQRLKQLREQRGWSQEQLAEIAGLSTWTVQRVEARGAASLETRMALAAALGIDASELGSAMHGPEVASHQGRSLVVLWMVTLLMIAMMFIIWFGHSMGRDAAQRDNRAQCTAEGRVDCR